MERSFDWSLSHFWQCRNNDGGNDHVLRFLGHRVSAIYGISAPSTPIIIHGHTATGISTRICKIVSVTPSDILMDFSLPYQVCIKWGRTIRSYITTLDYADRSWLCRVESNWLTWTCQFKISTWSHRKDCEQEKFYDGYVRTFSFV